MIYERDNGDEFSESELLNLRHYRLPRGLHIIPIYPKFEVGKGRADFDIHDYEMLFNDPATKVLIRKGDTIGCFYIESPGMRSLLRRLNCDDFEMLTAASSIIRPGVAESGMMQEFIDRHRNPKLRKYLIPEMETYLGDTYGVMIYQEDVIKVAHHIAGLTLEEADLLRRAMSGKMRSQKAMQKLNERFFSSCHDKGLSTYVAKELWRQIESFAGYAFCKAHSASFALLSFQVAYLKAHFPAEFLASVLSNHGGYYAASVYIQEARRLGIKIKLPSINESGAEYAGDKDEILIGLGAVKNLRSDTIDNIIRERKQGGNYVTLSDFIIRTDTGKEEAVSLIKCGAMDCLGVRSRPTLLRQADIYYKTRHIFASGAYNLFTDDILRLNNKVESDIDYSLEQKCIIEQETFDYMVTKHPLEFFEGWTSAPSIIKARDMERYHGKNIKMIGWFMTAKRIKTKLGKAMKFLSLEDLTGTFEAVLFPEAYAKYAEKTVSMGPYIVEGKVDAANGNNIIVEKLDTIPGVLSQSRDAMHHVSTVETYSQENAYFGDVEKFSEEDIKLVERLNKEKLYTAYVG